MKLLAKGRPLLILVFIVPRAFASDDACFERASTQAQISVCAANELGKIDRQLNTKYREIIDHLRHDEAAQSQLIVAQRKWIGFRDAECTFRTINSQGGSMNRSSLDSCLTNLTKARINQFNLYLRCEMNGRHSTSEDCLIASQ
ncbi:DUF1311 domain-containing protein [Comamonas sp. NyZ500]|uniref:lysozyme inhibitor LprI family protein n=1 Tax=Comamonas sp. NyZ500 TaxID=2795732 RepID=UPI00192B1F89|nr:DUF1311 domain-containing protein [Comamonas sp. NyZ500]